MIPRAAITAWRTARAPWRDDALVEHDLVMSRAIVDLFSDPQLAATLAFRGGTALHKLHFHPGARFSEDIDLVQVVPGPIGPQLDAIRSRLSWLGAAKHKQSANIHTLGFRFDTTLAPVARRKLKVEINTREQFNLRGLERRELHVASTWFNGSVSIPTYTLEELLGTKLRALYQRKKGRDVFDLAYALQRSPSPDLGAIVTCFGAYMAANNQSVGRRAFERNFDQKCGDGGFLSEVGSFLAPLVKFDAEIDAERVRTQILARLPD